jgi:hypothetical protein
VLDEAGVSMQVPSPDGPGADLLSSWEGAAWAREAKKPMTPSLVLSPLIQIASPAWRIYRLRVPMPPQTGSSLLTLKCALVRGSTNGWYLDHPSSNVRKFRVSANLTRSARPSCPPRRQAAAALDRSRTSHMIRAMSGGP